VRHFHEKLREEHGIGYGYTCIKQLLQGAGLVLRQKARPAPPSARAAADDRQLKERCLHLSCYRPRTYNRTPDHQRSNKCNPEQRVVDRYARDGAQANCPVGFKRR